MMRHRHHTTATLVAVFILLALGNTLIIYHDVILYLSGFVTNTNATNTTAYAKICINHPPSITPISDQAATAGTPFTLQVVATDKDSGQTLTYADNVAQFDIGAATGLIGFTPTVNEAFTPTITVTDSSRCAGNNATASFTITVTGATANVTTNVTNVTVPGLTGGTSRRGPRAPQVRVPPPTVQVPAPVYQIQIVEIIANGKLVYSLDKDIRLAEFVMEPNTIADLQITVRNPGFYPVTNVLLSLEPYGTATLISLNPGGYPSLDPGKETTFTAQLKVGEDPVKLTVKAISDQDVDTQIVNVVPSPKLETPTFGIQIPGWIPMIITIPLLFLLGYSVWSNREALRQLLQNLLGAFFALFLRRSYFLDEDMLRALVKEKKFNKLLHQHVVLDVYERYKDVYRNLRTIELDQSYIGKINNIAKVYKVPKELAMLIVMSDKKPRPRIMTQLEISDKLQQDFKRVKFYNPLKKKAETGDAPKKQVYG